MRQFEFVKILKEYTDEELDQIINTPEYKTLEKELEGKWNKYSKNFTPEKIGAQGEGVYFAQFLQSQYGFSKETAYKVSRDWMVHKDSPDYNPGEAIQAAVATILKGEHTGGAAKTTEPTPTPAPAAKPAAGAPKPADTGADDDKLYKKAVDLVVRNNKASTSYIQRIFQVGYNRAAGMIQRMEKEGIVGPADKVGKREVLSTTDGKKTPSTKSATEPTTASAAKPAATEPTSITGKPASLKLDDIRTFFKDTLKGDLVKVLKQGKAADTNLASIKGSPLAMLGYAYLKAVKRI